MVSPEEFYQFLKSLGCSDSQAVLSEDEAELQIRPGLNQGCFRYIDCVGHGGFGYVAKCTDTETGQTVAFKVPLTELHPIGQLRFLRESTMIKYVRHPSIVLWLGSEIFDGTKIPWLSMELIEGNSLYSKKPFAKDTKDGILQILQAAQKWFLALITLHETDCVHRDLKPANILWTDDRQWKIVDFGLSRMCSAPTLTNRNEFAPGTRVYMPHEQWNHGANQKSDQFSIASTLYEWLTGKRPYPSPEGLMAPDELVPGSAYRPPPAHSLNPLVGIDVSELLSQMLHQNQDKRFPTMREAAIRLSEAIARIDGENPTSRERLDKGLIASGMTRGLTRQIIRFRTHLGTILSELYFTENRSNTGGYPNAVLDSLETCRRIRSSLEPLAIAADDDLDLGGWISTEPARVACADLIESIDQIMEILKFLLRIEFACQVAYKVMVGSGSTDTQSLHDLLSIVERRSLRRMVRPAAELELTFDQVREIATRTRSILEIIPLQTIQSQSLLEPITSLRDKLGEVQVQLAHLDEQIISLEGVVRWRLSSN